MAAAEEVVVSKSTDGDDETNKEIEQAAESMSSEAGEFERGSFSIHLRRQAQLCKLALQSKYKYLPESVSQIGAVFEEFLFNPLTSEDKKQQEARMNFYPPFLIPECTACYSSFFTIMPIPLSCLANRTSTVKMKKLREKEKFDFLPKFDADLFVIADGLGGEVTATDPLPRKTRLVNLETDSSRLVNMKEKLAYVTQFAYPALNLPPKIYRALITCLYKPFQTGKEELEDVDYVFSDEVVRGILCETLPEMSSLSDKELSKLVSDFRKNTLKAIQYTVCLKIMQRVFRDAGFIKKMQEILHYTFHHGFIRFIGEITQKNLSNFVTFHGMTFENHNNNSCLHTTLDLNDGEDYMVDCIYLFLVMTWQTAMGIWQQNLNDSNLEMLTKLLRSKGSSLVLYRDVESMAEAIAEWITDDYELVKIFQRTLPDFISQTQITNFRNFILARSNIAGNLIPALPRDFVPLDFKESPPRLWGHVYLIHLSYFLYNHGDYCQTFFYTDSETKCPENEIYCNCNLCAPHRTPMYNPALHNEVLAIGTFDFFIPSDDGKGGQRVTLSPGMWANKYLDHFVAEEFFPFTVCKYLDYPEKFTKEPTACVITKPAVLSSIQLLLRKKEKFLLEKGSGIYLDPETGDNLSDAKLLSQPFESSVGARKYSSKRRNGGEDKEKKEKEDTR